MIWFRRTLENMTFGLYLLIVSEYDLLYSDSATLFVLFICETEIMFLFSENNRPAIIKAVWRKWCILTFD